METPKTFRVFVSSTFKDLESERNILQERVFPELRELCRSRGARFQQIDLRWGVSEEASLDQQAMNICLGEIERCRDVTPRPNFIVLLGNRHGWLALPPQIPAEEFEGIRGRVPAGEERDLLDAWYARDENALPPEHRLRPRRRGGPYGAPEAWEGVERRLHAILAAAIEGTALDGDPRYVASATAQEVLAGTLGAGGPAGHAFAFVRELTGDHPDPAAAAEGDPILDFVDLDQRPIDELKERLRAELPVVTYQARWDAEQGRPTVAHLADLARDVEEALRGAILEELERPSRQVSASDRPGRIQPHPALDAEGLAHRDFAEERTRVFVGRDDSLSRIAEYLDGRDPRPLVIEGAGGSGKSALLAEAVRRAQHDRPEDDVAYRFIGATPDSSDGRALLQTICEELARRHGAVGETVPSDYQGLVADFRRRLEGAGATRPTILFLDSLDQLSARHGARELTWLPVPLPAGVRMVVSTRPEDTLEALARGGAPVEELGPMPAADGRELLRRWLAEAGRTLQPAQERAVLSGFDASGGNPLYLRLAFEEARRWTGEDAPEALATGVEGIIARNTFPRLALEDNHGEVLVSHALGYLAASRIGLTEDELLDLLSRDPEVYEWFLLGAHHVPLDLRERAGSHRDVGEPPSEWLERLRTDPGRRAELRRFLEEILPTPEGPRLPVVLWSRLMFDLRPYLTERSGDDAVLITFFHRELGAAAAARYLGDGRAGRYHDMLSNYFRPLPDPEDRRRWAEASPHALGELPYHLAMAGEGRWMDLHDTLTNFGFLEAKAARVGVQRRTDELGREVVTYGGVYLLQDDFDLALRAMSGEESGPPRARIIVTATDFGDGLVVRCPHCNTVHPFRDEWLGQDIACPNDSCGGSLTVNPFVVGTDGTGPQTATQDAAPPEATPAPPVAADGREPEPEVPLSGGAERLLAEGEPSEGSAGVHHWLLTLLRRHGPMAEDLVPGIGARQLADELSTRLRGGDAGPSLPRGDLVGRAAQHARARGKDVVAERDLAAAILAAAGYEVAG